MALTLDEKALIKSLRSDGKSNADIIGIIGSQRAGRKDYYADEQRREEFKATNPFGTDVAIGFGKQIASDISMAGAHKAGPVGAEMLRGAPDFKANVDALDKSLVADNNAQVAGKVLAVGAEIATPLAAPRLAGLVSKSMKNLPSVSVKVPDSAGGIVSSVKTSVQSALARETASPQLESSARRLFSEGTKRIEDPIADYDQYLAQSKKALSDIKEDPAVAQVGEKIGDEFRFVVEQRRHAGEVMGEELKKVGGIKTSIDDTFTQFETALKEADLVYNASKKTVVPGRASKMTAEDVGMLESYIKELNKLGANPTIAEIDGMIARTQSLVNNFKSAKGIMETTNAERLIKQNQYALRQQLDPVKAKKPELANYAKARALYSELSDFIDEGASHLGKITQSGDFAKDASIAKSAVQSILNSGKKDWLVRLEELTGYPALDDSVLALQAMKDAGDFRGLSLLQLLSDGATPTSQAGFIQKAIDFAMKKVSRVVTGTPEEQTRAFLKALQEELSKTAQ